MKKLLVLAVVCMMATPTFAQAETANANVYGTFNTTVESVKALGATSGTGYESHTRLNDNSTNVGVKGSEDLGGDLKAIFQVELDVRPAAGTLPGLRNSMVGVQGGWGTFFMGKWDTPYKSSLYFMDPFWATGVGWMASLMDRGAQGQDFALRQANTLNYWSPKFMGLNANLLYSPKSSTAGAMDYLFSGSLNYSEGPINAAFAYEVHNAVNDSNKDTGMKVGAGYKLFDTTTLGVAWGSIANKVTAGDVKTKKNTIEFTATHKISDFTIRGGYAISGKTNVSTTGDVDLTGAKQLSVGGSYSLSKRTDLYALFARISNDDAARYNFNVGSVNPNSATDPTLAAGSAGADPQSFAFGIRHTF